MNDRGTEALIPNECALASQATAVQGHAAKLRLLASEFGRILNIAHKGAAEATRANSLDGIRDCVRLGIDAIEIDVQGTRDHELILFHDQFVGIDSKRSKVSDLRFEELTTIVNGAAEKRPPVARLREALSIVRNANIMALLEIKSRNITDAVIEEIYKADVAEKTAITSFEYSTLRRAKDRNPSVSTVVTIGFSRFMKEITGFVWTIVALLFPLLATRLVRAEAVSCPAYRITRRLVKEAHSRGVGVFAWQVTSYEQLQDMVALEVDGLVNDIPLTAQQELRRQSLFSQGRRKAG